MADSEKMEKAKEAAHAAEEKAKEAAHAAGEKAKDLAGTATEKIRKIKESPKFQSVRPLTWAGLAITLAFFICMFIDTVNVRWWIMLPLGALGMFVLWRQWKSTPMENEFNMKVSFIGLLALLALLLLRDAWLSTSLAELYDKVSETSGVLEEFNKLLGK